MKAHSYRIIAIAMSVIASHVSFSQSGNEYVLMRNQRYMKQDTLKADLYLPVKYQQQANPVLIFFSVGNFRSWSHYINWAKLGASQGFASIVYSATHDDYEKNFNELVDFIRTHSREFKFDEERIAVYAGSGPMMDALPVVNRDLKIKAALMFYGTATIDEFRVDLPVLLLRAGLDNTHLNKGLDSLAFRALQANAPYTILNANASLHAFEDIEDPEAKRVMLASLDFLRNALRPEVQKGFQTHRAEVLAMRELYHSRWSESLKYFKEALEGDPGNNETERQMGNVYIELGEYRSALISFDNSLSHGNWRKGEIAKKKCYAYAKLNNIEGAISEMSVLRKIGWFRETDYANSDYTTVTTSTAYHKFLSQK